VAIFSTTVVNVQNVAFGAKAGLNLASVYGDGN